MIADEFVTGEHQFQEQVHVRTLLFDYLWNLGLVMYLWADRSAAELARWPDIAGDDAARRRAVEHLRTLVAGSPLDS